MRFALRVSCRKVMPAIASLEDLKAAQKDTLSIYLRYLSSEVLEGMT
jgi:hypothetical protein